jgi:site-specific recombinase XerD
MAGKAGKYFSNLDAKDEIISVDQIISEIKGKGRNQMTLIRAFEYHITTIKALSGIDFTESTIDKYGYALNSIRRFLKNYYNKTDIRLCDLDYGFIAAYYEFLIMTEKLMHNSATKYIKICIRIINVSISNKWLVSNPFKDFNCNYVNPPRSYLTEEEIEDIYKKEFIIKRLAKVKDVFIFQIYTGLSYIDMAGLTEDNIEIGIDGKQWIVINRKKTGTRSSIPILPRVQEVLNKYKNDPLCISEHKILPFYCNQRMNGYLKEIADICEIKKPLTTHIARHTFATTITLSHGVPIETVSKMLGHSDLKTTQIYSKVVDRKIADDMQKL